MNRKGILLVPTVLAAAVLAPALVAEPVSGFRQAITQTVLTSPRVNASWYNFEATREAQTSARAGYLPSVDLSAEIGKEERETPLIDTGSYTRDATRFSITQMLFDGFQTREEVSRLGYEKLSRYYQLKRASEETALEAANAYIDTMRYQKLVRLAESNYVVHRQIFNKITERSVGGVSQGVDLEQATGRVALAESNLLTEMTNLHDVRARFQRIVGDLPADALIDPTIPSSMIPQQRQGALNMAYEQSPEINGTIENLRSTQSAMNATNAPLMPRLDLRYRNEREHDTDGFDGRFDEEAIELVFTYNLFRGGADSARKREYYNRFNAAIEERKQACLNVRQNVMIAFNDIGALEQQLIYLNRNRLSQDKTRRAYRDQFDLGRRTLLDLLDSQNEYFDTQRSYSTAHADLLSAQATTLSNMGLLLAALDVSGLNDGKIAELNLNLGRGDDENGQPLCPPEAPTEIVIDKEALFEGLMASNTIQRIRYRDESNTDSKASAEYSASSIDNSTIKSTTGSADRSTSDPTLNVEVPIAFRFNSYHVSASQDFGSDIARLAGLLRDNPSASAVVEGYTDSSGADPHWNLLLSGRRANTVRDKLIESYGLNPDQITAVGYGAQKPIASNNTREGRKQNRRVILVMDAPAPGSE